MRSQNRGERPDSGRSPRFCDLIRWLRGRRRAEAARGGGSGLHGRLEDGVPGLPALALLPRIRDRNRREQTLRVRVDGVAHDLRGLADLDEVAVAHDGDALGDPFDHRQIMADEQARESVLLLQAFEQVEDLRLHRYVERRGRLVGDEQLRPQGQSAGDADALTLTAGELMGVADVHRCWQLERLTTQLDCFALLLGCHSLWWFQ